MAQSKCGSCGESKGWEHKEPSSISGTNKRYCFIQCVSCGAVVGVVEGWHLSSALARIMQKLGVPTD